MGKGENTLGVGEWASDVEDYLPSLDPLEILMRNEEVENG